MEVMKKIQSIWLLSITAIVGVFLCVAAPTYAVLVVEEEEVTEEDVATTAVEEESSEDTTEAGDAEEIPEDEVTEATEEESDDDEETVTTTTTSTVDLSSTDTVRRQVAGLDLQAGSILRLSGDTDKDIFAAANIIDISDTVEGDVFAACSEFTLTGAVEESVRVAGNIIVIDGPVKGNLLVFGNSVRLTENADIDGHVNIYAGTVTMKGTIEKTAHIGAGFVTIDGTFNHTATVEAGEVQFGNSAVLENELLVKSPQEPVTSTNTYGTDLITYEQVADQQYESQIYQPEELAGVLSFFVFFKILHLIFWSTTFMLLGIVLVIVAPTWTTKIAQHTKENIGKTWLTGALFFFLAPIVAIILMVTVLGLPIAALLMITYSILFVFGRIFIGYFLGRLLVKPKDGDTTSRKVLQFFLGYLILTVLFLIPVLGWLLSGLAGLWGMGAVVHHYLVNRQSAGKETPKKESKPTKKKPTKKKASSK